MMIETDRLILRGWRDADRSPLAVINANPIVMEFLGPPNGKAASDAAIDRMIALERKSDRCLLGFIGLKRINFDAGFGPGHEIGWRLAPEYWEAGYATEGARAALRDGFERFGWGEVFSFTSVNNFRSQAVMKRIGMKRVENGDFDHPDLEPGDPFRRHILFRIERPKR